MFKKLAFNYSVYMEMLSSCSIEVAADNYILTVKSKIGPSDEKIEKLSPEKSREISEEISKLGLQTWHEEYSPEYYCVEDGYEWEVVLEEKEGKNIRKTESRGFNAFPWCFYMLIRVLIKAVPEAKEILEEYAEEVECFY